MESGIYLTIKDLMKLTGSYSYAGTGNTHRALKDAIAPNKRKITIREYCTYEGVSFEEIWEFLRSKPAKKT
jgi:hypothetical protein